MGDSWFSWDMCRTHGIYITQLLFDQWPCRSSTLQSQSSCWGTYFLRKYGDVISGMEWLHWRRGVVMSDWLIFLLFHYNWGISSMALQVGALLTIWPDLLHYDVRRLLLQLLVLLQRCKLHCTTAKVLLYGKWHDLFFIHVSSACFQSGFSYSHVKSLAFETVVLTMVHLPR